jgi:hypothetical protein
MGSFAGDIFSGSGLGAVALIAGAGWAPAAAVSVRGFVDSRGVMGSFAGDIFSGSGLGAVALIAGGMGSGGGG